MKNVVLILFCVGWVFFWPAVAWELDDRRTCSFTAIVPLRVTVDLGLGNNSAATDAQSVKFDKLDSGDMTDGSQSFMYAPYRSQIGKNWHLAKIIATGTGNVTLKVEAALTGIENTRLKVWFGGFYGPNETTPRSGTGSSGWEPMVPPTGATKTTPGPFTGECPLSYQLNISGLTAQTYTGQITITVTQ